MANKNIVIKLENVSKNYDLDAVKVHALRDVSLEIEEGELLGIIGAVAGVLPAMRAAKLQPVEALRYE